MSKQFETVSENQEFHWNLRKVLLMTITTHLVDNGEDNSAVNELEFDLNQLREARPDLAPENLDTDGLVHFYRKVSANESRPLSVDEIVNV